MHRRVNASTPRHNATLPRGQSSLATGKVGSMRRFLGVAMANLDTPDLVRDAHLAYIDAGADEKTTNNSLIPKILCYQNFFSFFYQKVF